MPAWIYKRSNIEILLIFVILFLILMDFLPRAIRLLPMMAPSEESTHLGYSLFSPLAGCSGLLIGFLLNQAQTNLREIKSIVSAEAGRINNLDRLLTRYGDIGTLEIRDEIFSYIDSIIEEEWNTIGNGQGSHKTHMLWRNISKKIMKLDPQTNRQTAIYADIIKKSEEVAESREMRIERATDKLPQLFWVVIGLCIMALTAVNTLFLPLDSYTLGLKILPILFGALISLLVITDQPFRGQTSIQPDALRKILISIKSRVE